MLIIRHGYFDGISGLAKAILVLVLVVGFSLLSSCNTCGPVTPATNTNSEIFLSALPLNSVAPAVFGIKSDGSSLRQILENAVIYSAPSSNSKIAVLRRKLSGETVILSYDFKSDSLLQIATDNYYTALNFPVISSNGIYITFIAGKDSLLLAKGVLHKPVSYNLCPGSLPAFSPDASMLAFFEGDSLSEPLRVKIVKTDDPAQVVLEKQFAFGIENWQGIAGINWSADGSSIAFVISDDAIKADVVNIFPYNNTTGSKYEMIDFGAFNPVISPDFKYFAFVARDMNIWTRNISTDPRYFKLSSIDSAFESCNYPQWSGDGKNVLYMRYPKSKTSIFDGNLYLVNFENKLNRLLCNNVLNAFWVKP